MKNRFLPIMLAMMGLTPLLQGTAQAAPAASSYSTAMGLLAPQYYLPFDEYGNIGGTPGSAVTDATGNLTTATYQSTLNYGNNFGGNTVTPLIGTTSATTQMTSCCTAAGVIGANWGPNAVNEFTAEGSAGWVSSQLPGFNPDYSATGTLDVVSTTVNRSWEANRSIEVRLGPTATVASNLIAGGAFTWAGWVKVDGDGLNTGTASEPVRLFDTGGGNTDASFFQVVSGGTAGFGLAVSGTVGGKLFAGDRDVDQGKGYIFLVVSTSGSTDALQLANTKIWHQFSDRTSGLSNTGSGFGASNEGNGTPAANSVRMAKLGYRDVSVDSVNTNLIPLIGMVGGSSNTNSGFRHTFGGSMDEVAIWNRELQLDERESLYVAGTDPTGGPRTVTFVGLDGGAPTQYGLDGANWDTSAILATDYWISAGANSTAAFPGKNNGKNQPYHRVVIDANATASDTGLSNRYGAGIGYYPTYSLTVNSGDTLTVNTATTMRSYEDQTINGSLVMNGITGTIGPNVGVNAASRAATIDSGRDVIIGVGASVTMSTPFNVIKAEEDIIFNSGSYVLSAMTGAPAANAHLFSVLRADFDAGSGSLLQAGGVITGRFSSHTLPADEGAAPFRRPSVLYENRAPDGVGAVDTMKIGYAQPGDMNFDSIVDFTDAGDFGSWYENTSGTMTWRTGDFDADGNTSFSDAADFGAFFGGGSYVTTPGSTVDGIFSLVYNVNTGICKIEGPGGQQYKVVNLTSASGQFNINVANWIPQPFQSNTTTAQGYSTIGAGLLTSNGYVIGAILDPGLTQAFLLNDLTVRYAINGVSGPQQIGNLIWVPEPSSFALLAMGLVGLAVRRRRRQAA